MKRLLAAVCYGSVLILAILLFAGKRIALPFSAGEVRFVELYHYEGVPSAAARTDITDRREIEAVLKRVSSIRVFNSTPESVAGSSVTGLRFELTDGTVYALSYADSGSGPGILTLPDGVYRTGADLGGLWELYGAPAE